MGKENQKKVLAALLAAAIAVPTPVLAASPSDFTDFPDNWAKSSLSHSVSSGLLSGADGKIRPSDGLKRAEMAAIINRLSGAEETASLAGYQDVSTSAWYYQDMAKALRMGTFVGDGGMLHPEAPITRQEAFAVLARYYCLQNTNTDVLQKYADMQQVSTWAKNAMAAMVEAGYIHGDNGKLNPLAPITRAEFSQVLYNLAGTIVDQGETVSTDVSGNLIVRGTDVALKNMMVQGDLILADGASSAKLEGVTVQGRIVVRGGTKGIDIKESKANKGLLISNPNKPTVVSAEKSNLGEVSLWSDAHLSGDFSDIVIHKPIRLDMQEGKAAKLLVNDAAKEAEIKVGKDAAVGEIRIEAADVKVGGDGSVAKVQVNGDNTQISTKHTKVTVGSSVQGVKADGKDVLSNTSVTTGEKESGKNVKRSTSGGSSGNASGASHKQKVYTASNWKELRQAVLDANAGDTIRLQANILDAGSETGILLDGVSSATLPLAKKNLILDGNGHTISAAEGKTFCFDVDGKDGEATGLEIRNLTVDGASFSKKLGGAFFVEDGATVTFDKVTIRNAKAGHGSEFTGGGAIFINDHGNPPEVTVKGCVFENNTVPAKDGASFVGRGGAIYVNNFRSANAVKLTVMDSTFRGNKAAYGGAVAADGVVELKVENCTFAENSGTVGADDIYIFDGISAGKKERNIASAVTAVMKGNTYSNISESADDMTAMNVIFGRYYPADFKGNPGVAPEGARDLTFSDMKRTQLQKAVEAIPMTAAEIQGKTYYYGVPVYVNGMFVTKFTVNGAPVEAQKIGDTNVYYYAAEQPTGTYYGMANVPFADFYYGELQDVSMPVQNSLVTKVDAASALRSRGQYDAVTSATTKKWNQYATTYGKAKEDGSGSVLGLQTPIAVDASIYVQGLLAEKAGASAPNRMFTILSSMTEDGRQITTEPTQQYKILYADGRLSAMHNDGVPQLTAAEVTAEIKDQTPWGHYLIQVNGLPAEIKVKENLMGVILTDDQGNRYGLKQVDNLFLKNASELAFSVKGYTEPHGNKMQYQRFADLPGRTITSITYLVKGYQNFTVDHLHLYCGKQLAAEQVPVVTEKTAFESQKGATVKLDVSKLPYTGVELVSVKMGSGKKAVTLEKGTDYTFENHTLQILDTEKTEKGMYTVAFADTNKEGGYVSSSISVNLDEAAGKMAGLSDGEWYGTGSWSRNYTLKGPDVVKVTITDGAIAAVESVKYSDDSHGVYPKGKEIMKHTVGLTELSSLYQQLNEKRGVAYDAVSGATETAKGHLSAIENALARSRQYAKDHQDQQITWMEFKTQPVSTATLGTPLDLSQAVLVLHQLGGGQKEVAFQDFAENGITTNYQNGTSITSATEGLNDGALLVKFTHALSQTTIPAKIAFLKVMKQRTPSHILVTFADQTTQRIELNATNFRYPLTTEKAISKVEVYDAEKKLADGSFEAQYNEWKISLKGVPVGEGYAEWKFPDYYIKVDTSADESNVASFTLDTSLISQQYGVGDVFDLSKINISLKTEKGNPQHLIGWNACLQRGFSADLEQGHVFTERDTGEKTITISAGAVKQTFKVTVMDYASQVPAKVELYDSKKDKLLQTVPVDAQIWKRDKGCVMLSGIELPDTLKSWRAEDFKVKVYNTEGQLLQEKLYSVAQDFYKDALEIDFPRYKEYYSEGGYLKLYFRFKESEGETAEESPEETHNETAESSATVDGFGYDAKVQVTYNPKTGQIVSVKDHGTEPGGNTHFWEMAAAMFEKFTGKTVGEIDNVDAVSGATLSSNAIKAAVKKALSSTADEEPNVTAEGSAAVGSFGYKAQVSVTYNKKTGEILSVADSGTVPGMNESFWNAAKAMFAKFTGKTAKDIDSIDAVSKATVSSDAIKAAVKQALSSTEDTVDAPKLIAADARTNLLFAATEPALLTVAAPEEAEVFYTTDDSDPTQDGKKKLMNTMLSLSPSENKDEKITVKAAANKNGKWSRVTEIPVEFVKIPPLDNGTKTYVGQAVCAGGAGQPYAVKVRVTTVNGRIALLQDNGTEASADTDHAFWWGWDVMGEAGMPAKLKGKSLEELLKAKTTPSEQEEQKVDAVSGATLSSDAVKYAAIAALRSEPVESSIGEVTPPVLTSSRQVAPNSDINSISVVMTGEKGAVIHYTVDGSEPTEASPVASALPPFQEDKGVVLRPETSSHSDGRMIVVKAAAYLDGKRSTTVTERYVFANAKSENSYRLGSFEGTTDGITAKIEVGSPNFDSQYYITKIILDDESRIAYKDFLPELLSQVYLKQGVQGVAQVQDHEAESKRILAAIDAALKEAVLAATPVIQVTPEQSNYPNDAKVTLTLTCATPDAEVYYVVDNSNTLTGGRLSDFETNKMLYEDAVSLTMDQAKGGTLYIRAAAKTGEKNWSPTARKDLSFVKAVQADAFQVGEQGYGTWKEAVAALEKAGGGEILLRDDVELLKTDSLPSVSCTIRSADDQKHRIKGAVMEAKADITFENVIYDINRIYASGHNVTIGADIETPFSFWNRSIFAGPAHDADETDISASPVITVESGKFALYGSGGGKTTVHGNVEIHVNGTASAEVGGAYMSAVVDGSVSVFVENTATLETFLGEQNGGNLTDLTLTVTGSPSLAGRSYRGSVNGTPKGTLDLKAANFSEEEIKKFKDFEKIIKAEMAAAEAEPLLVQPHEMTVLSEDEVTEEPALAEESALPEEPEATTVLPKEEEMMASETTETLPEHTEPMLEDSEIAS